MICEKINNFKRFFFINDQFYKIELNLKYIFLK